MIQIIILLSVIGFSFTALADDVPSGGTTTISVHGKCRDINNTTGKTIWIGTATSAEWISFANKFVGHPAGLTNTRCHCNNPSMNDATTCAENPGCSWIGTCAN